MRPLRYALHHHDHRAKGNQCSGKRNHRIMKKISKLEGKLGKYKFDAYQENSDSPPESDNLRSRSRSRSKGRNHHKQDHEKLVGSHDNSRSHSSSSGDSRSPSPCQHRHHRRSHLPRPKSFCGRGSHFPSPIQRCPKPPHHRHQHSHPLHQHPHPPHHHRHPHHHHPLGARYARHCRNYVDKNCRQFKNKFQDCFTKLMEYMDPDIENKSSEQQKREDLIELESQLISSDNAQEAQVTDAVEAEEDQEIDGDAPEGSEIDQTLVETWTDIIKNGLPFQTKKALLNKYPVSKNCLFLKGPKINKEISPVITETSIKKDIVQTLEQKKIGIGLVALSKVISQLNNLSELKEEDVVNLIDTLNEAAIIILDVHHDITEARRAFILSELRRRTRSVIEACGPDEFLFGKDLGEKLENNRAFKKGRKNPKDQTEKGEKCTPINSEEAGDKPNQSAV